MKNRYLLLTLLMTGFLQSAAQAEVPAGLRPVDADNKTQCVEYYTQPNGAMLCSEQALQKSVVDPQDLKFERLSLRFDGRPWQAGFWNHQPQSPVWEYVVQGETVESWTELVSTHFFPNLQKQTSSSQFMQIYLSQFQKQGFNPQVTIIRQTPQDVLYEWALTNTGAEDQDELQRIFTTNEGIYMVRYTSRPTISVKNRMIWSKLLQEAVPKAKTSIKAN